MLLRLDGLAGIGKGRGEPDQRVRRLGHDGERTAVSGLGFGGVAGHEAQAADRLVHFVSRVVERLRTCAGLFRCSDVRRHALEQEALDARLAEPGLCAGEVRFFRERSLKQLLRSVERTRALRLAQVRESLKVEVVRRDVVNWPRCRRSFGIDAEDPLEGSEHLRADLVLDRKKIAGRLVGIRPLVGSARAIDEGGVDAHEVALAPDAAFDDVAHAERVGDAAHVDILALVGERGPARGDAQSRYAD